MFRSADSWFSTVNDISSGIPIKELAWFSLIEISIVLIIVGLLAGAAVAPLGHSVQQARYRQAQHQLQAIRVALHGYLVSAGHLPCPLASGETDSAKQSPDQLCNTRQGGLPAVSLGLLGVRSATGSLLDPWGREYQYAVSLSDHPSRGRVNVPDWINAGELASVGAEALSADLQLCVRSVNGLCPQNALVATQIVWLVFSHGETHATAGVENENNDRDAVFAHSPYSIKQNNRFDDQMVWASRSELVFWLLKANWLP